MKDNSKDDFLALFVDSQAFARVLRVFIFDQSHRFTLAQIIRRAGVTSAVAKLEIKELERLKVIMHSSMLVPAPATKRAKPSKGKSEKVWHINPDFKHLRALSVFVHEVSPAQYDTVLDALKRVGKVGVVILTGSFLGDSSRPVDLLVAGETISDARLDTAVRKLEPIFGREIRYASFSTPEFRYRLTIQDRLIRDVLDFPHTVLLDRGSVL